MHWPFLLKSGLLDGNPVRQSLSGNGDGTTRTKRGHAMPTTRRHVTVTAPPHRWKLLGELLTDRRKDLGYTYRAPRFDKASGINQRHGRRHRESREDPD